MSGVNALGRLLMELRQLIKFIDKESLFVVPPLDLDNFNLMGKSIGTICACDVSTEGHHQNRLDI